MRKVNIECKEDKLCSPEEVVALMKAQFTGEAWFMLEQPHRFLAGDFADFPADWCTPRLGSCTLFSEDKELVIEPEKGAFVYRLIVESEGENFFARKTSYLLRKHKATEVFLKKAPALSYTEYFELDEDGMPQLKAGRLSGLAGGHNG